MVAAPVAGPRPDRNSPVGHRLCALCRDGCQAARGIATWRGRDIRLADRITDAPGTGFLTTDSPSAIISRSRRPRRGATIAGEYFVHRRRGLHHAQLVRTGIRTPTENRLERAQDSVLSHAP